MKYARFIRSTVMAGSLALLSGGSALAADTIDTTGPDSTNIITNSNTSTYSEDNANTVTVVNTNDQTATTGDATVTDNTNSGSASTGDASNNNVATTRVAIAGSGTGVGAVGGSGGGSGSGGSGGSGGGSVAPVGGSGGGSVLGASTTGVGGFGGGAFNQALLPETGPSSPIDVSALRSLFNPSSTLPEGLVKQSNGISAAFLFAAAALSLLGAIGSALYANRREQQL